MKRSAFLSIAAAVLLVTPVAAQDPPDTTPWEMPESLEQYLSLTLEEKIEIYKAVVASSGFSQFSALGLSASESRDPSLGGYDELLRFLPLSPLDMFEIDMILRRYEVVVPRITNEMHLRWVSLQFGPTTGSSQADSTVQPRPRRGPLSLAGTKAAVETNRNSAYDYSPEPLDYDGEIQVVVNPLDANQIVSMANTWGNMGNPAVCGDGTQSIFFSSDGGTSWGYTCAPRGTLYNLTCSSGIEFGSDPALYWDDANNIFANYMSLCYDPILSRVSGYAMVVAKSTDGGATWEPHGVIKNSYATGTLEDKNFYIIDNHSTSPHYGRHYSCWDRANNEIIAYSTDDGKTWTEADLPDPASGLDLQCEMAVEDDGTVHVIFDNLTCGVLTCSDEDMYYTRSTDGGATWSSLVHVRDFTDPISFGANAKYGPQDARGLNPFGAIDVDNSGGSCDGNLYVTFTDDSDANGVGTADIWVTRSTDGGGTWEAPVRVNDTPDPDTSIQFHPFLVIDQGTGAIYVAWHDARNDPNNRAIDYYVAQSTDCGQTWANVQASQPSAEFNNPTISYSNESTVDNSNFNPNQYGEYMGLDVHNGTAYLAWSDTRHFFPGSTSESQQENVGFAKVTFCEAAPPTGLGAATAGNNAIQLDWTSAAGATEYRVYRSTTSGIGYTQVGTVTPPATSYLDTTVQGGITYYYLVSSYNSVHGCESVFSSEASTTATGLCDLPPTFSGLASAAGNGSCGIDLSWPAAEAPCGGSVSYAIYRSTTSGIPPSASNRIAVGLSGTGYTDTNGMTGGATYHYIVRATDESNGQEDTNAVEQADVPTGPALATTLYGTESFDTYATGDMAGWGTGFFEGSAEDWRGVQTCSAHSGSNIFKYGGAFCTADYAGDRHSVAHPPEVYVPAGSQNTRLTFYHRWWFQNGQDGAYLRISFDGQNWWYVDDSAILQGGYNNTGLLPWWSGKSSNFSFSEVDLDAACDAVTGESGGCQDTTIWVGFVVWTSTITHREGWFIDDVTITTDVPGPCSSTPSAVEYLTARSTSDQVKLEWVNPPTAYGSTRICRDEAAYPTDPTACSTVVVNQSGTAGAYDSYTDTTANNGTKYYYTAFVNNGSNVFSGGKNAWAYPFDSDGEVKWSYSSAASSLAPTGVWPGAIGTGGTWAVSNDRMLHGMNPTAAGGDWPRTAPYSWTPMPMNGPAQARPPVVPTTAVSGASKVVFLGSEDGHAYAANAETGSTLWQSPALANMLIASPTGMFTDFGGSWNLLFIGSRDATADNVMYALDPADGSVEFQFDNGGGANGIGIISSAASVDYANNRIYFASRAPAGGSSDTLWCLSFTGTSFTKLWSAPFGDIDGAPIPYGGRLYVGNNAGRVYAVNPDTGATHWSYDASGDGAVKGYVVPQAQQTLPRRLYFSTTSRVWAINDNDTSASLGWSVTTVPGPSIPLAPLAANELYAGSSNGRLYQLNADTGAVESSVVLGDGSAAIGSPARDGVNDMAYVGSESGAVYGVQLPLQ